ncbi:MAG: M1 family peptidase, partial [Bacteroidia bacterium]|nr:M1 family peptidase [Bacteroidia bacterium]
FQQVKPMIHCFEYWFGAYPFYADGYKLVEAPFLGMEHQSAIAYGNDYQQGYKGRDLSNTGWGLKWDFIIVHESGHEWFGNNISAQDVADDWIHESFTAYSENLYTEYLFGKKAGADYVIGTRLSIANDRPIIADYNVNAGGSIDIYYKGANMLHTIRQIVNNDSLWRGMLRGLNSTFRHQTVNSGMVEEYMKDFLKIDLQKVFDQYLRTTQIPQLEYKIKKGKLSYRWTNCVKGFNMPVKILGSDNKEILLHPTEKWQKMVYEGESLSLDKNFYANLKKQTK